jgi:tetratricopeptide (TPR) repeat protein
MRSFTILMRTALACGALGATFPLQGQATLRNNFESVIAAWELRGLNESSTSTTAISSGTPIVSVDDLRYPVSAKVRRLLEKAERKSDLGNHAEAIEDLHQALIKFPTSAPYVHNLLGREYISSGQYSRAEESFEEAVRLMPHESAHHSNLGLTLAILGKCDRAKGEVREALQLNSDNEKAKHILEAIKGGKTSCNAIQ